MRTDLSAVEWSDFFRSKAWNALTSEWEVWASDILSKLRDPKNERDEDMLLKGNLQTLERVLATAHYIMQDFEDELEKEERKDTDGEAERE